MATITSTQSGLWSAGGTWVGGSAPADGDAAVIAAAHNVQVDSGVDQSAWTGLLGMTVTGGANPGMVFWKDDAVNGCGILRFRTGADIVGTNDTNNGRILANVDGSWATSTALSYAYKAIILLNGTATIDCASLDVRMRPDEPIKSYVRTYGTKYEFEGDTGVDPATDTIDLGTTPPSAGTAVQVVIIDGGGTLPTGLYEDTIYYVRSVAGNTCKLALQNSDDQIVDITADGTLTLAIVTGYTTSVGTTVNVLDDVTADNWTSGDSVVLCNIGPQNYDQQRTTVDTINAGTMVLGEAVNSTQYPCAIICLSTMNCSILHSSTSGSEIIIDSGSNCIFGEIRATAGTGTTFYCYGINSGSGHTAATITGCSIGIYLGSGHTVTTISGCDYGIIFGSGNTATTISGCTYGIYSGSGNTATTISGCNNGIYSGSGNTATTISGCGNGIISGSGNTVTTISGCSSGIYSGSGNTVTTISGCTYGINSSGSGNTATTISGCTYGIYFGSGNTVTTISGCDYGIISSSGNTATTISGCNNGIIFGSGNRIENMSGNIADFDTSGTTYASGGIIPSTPVNNSLDQDGEVTFIFSEDHAGVFGAQKIFQSFGDAIKCAAGEGDPTPNQRPGGNDTLIELSNLQANLSGGYANNKVIAWEPRKVRILATSGVSKTYRFYIQSTFALTADEIKLKALYHASGADTEWTLIESDETITVRDDLDDWDQYLEVTINPARTGWIMFEIELYLYSVGGRVYIDPLMVIS